MLRNYLKVAVRSLVKNPVSSFINIGGLAIGISSSILILLWVTDEVSFDKFHAKADRLYHVWANAEFDGKINFRTSLPLPTHEGMKSAEGQIGGPLATSWYQENR